MKLISETRGLEKLRTIRSEFAAEIRVSYEHKAKPCASCDNPGKCCRDEHFVNVRVSKLEAVAIRRRLDELPDAKRDEIYERVAEVVEKYGLSAPGDPSLKTYACPLFEKGLGCLVHDSAKPLPCIAHACYEVASDLPPSELLGDAEARVAALNNRVYGRGALPTLLPVAVADLKRPPITVTGISKTRNIP